MLLHSNIIGTGKPLVILHGFLGMGDNWKTLGKQFAEVGYEVHLLDLRNHGRSFHSDTFNYSLMVEDIHYYCEHYQLPNSNLLGHSMGGKVAMQYAMAYPEHLSKLIIADIGPKYYPAHHQTILESLSALSQNDGALQSRNAANTFLETYIPEIGTRQFLLKNLYRVRPDQLALRVNLPVLIKNIDEIGAPLQEVVPFNNPTLFLRGERSDYIQKEDQPMIRSIFTQVQIKTIPKAGHWIHAENPKEFYAEVINFL